MPTVYFLLGIGIGIISFVLGGLLASWCISRTDKRDERNFTVDEAKNE